jgi:hypothetical protein
VAARWNEVVDFTNATRPTSQNDTDIMVRTYELTKAWLTVLQSLVQAARKAPPNAQGNANIDFKNRVVLV